MALKKSDLDSSLWGSCDELRGGIPTRDIDALRDYWNVCPELRSALFADVTAAPAALPAGMHAEYRDTHFLAVEHGLAWPDEFAIITGYATTGEKWTPAENEAADLELERELRQRSPWVHRLTGYSPHTLHAEPGWAAALPFDAACDLGVRYRQDAIYYVRRNVLSVSYCDTRRHSIEIGRFGDRVHVSER